MDIVQDIHSLTAFKRETARFLKRMKKTGQPMVLTVNGRAELVVHDANSYQRFLEVLERAEAIAGIRKGLEDVKKGRTRPFSALMNELSARHEV